MKIITEFCQNHNGSFDILKKMICEAAEGGATHGKIQTIFADDLSFRERFEEGKIDSKGNIITIKRPYKQEYQRLKSLELSYDQHQLFIEECKKSGLIPLTTSFNITSICKLKDLGWQSIKVASYDCGSLPMIRALADNFNELIISTGATFDYEIENTANYLNNINKKFTFLHCITIYPTPLKYMNLKRMEYLKKFTQSVGLSEHSLVSTDGIKASIAAIYLGANTVERHFTVLPEEETRDGKVSVRKKHLKELVYFSKLSKNDQKEYIYKNVPEFEKMLGRYKRELIKEELLNRDYYRGRFCNKIKGKQIFNWEYEYK
ncbi:MAG: general stress protein [Actinobacteria bacterium]|nr:general stress protein [Actinomycetota bacterium]MBM3711912.1 general stress protein [Actinomycetota bacterium]